MTADEDRGCSRGLLLFWKIDIGRQVHILQGDLGQPTDMQPIPSARPACMGVPLTSMFLSACGDQTDNAGSTNKSGDRINLPRPEESSLSGQLAFCSSSRHFCLDRPTA